MPLRARVGGSPSCLPAPTVHREQSLRLRLRNLDSGAVLDLAEPEWRVRTGASGLDDVGIEAREEAAAGAVGTVVVGWSMGAREVFLAMSTRQEGLDALASTRARLRAIAPLKRLVRLEVVVDLDPGERVRWIDGHRVSDGALSWDSDTWGVEGRQVVPLRLHCPDPWVRSAGERWEWSGSEGGGIRLPMRFPMRLRPPTVLGRARSLAVIGDAHCHGVWTLRGPLVRFTATLPETGETWSIVPPGAGLAEGETAIVHTDPRVARDGLRVVGPDGSSWWRYVEAPRALWAIPPDRPEVLVEIEGASAQTRAWLDPLPVWEAFL